MEFVGGRWIIMISLVDVWLFGLLDQGLPNESLMLTFSSLFPREDANSFFEDNDVHYCV